MHNFLDAKIMAKALRKALAERRVDITHAESLELVARQFGVANWNVLAATMEAADAKQPRLPPGWYRTGQWSPEVHSMGADPGRPGTLKIEALAGSELGEGAFGSLARTMPADGYRGGKIRFTAELMGTDCDRAAIWMRVDSSLKGKWLRFDNLIDRAGPGPLSGSFGWTARTIVLDVPEQAARIVYGVMLIGAGTLWARAIEVGAADPDTPRTDYPQPRSGRGDGVPA